MEFVLSNARRIVQATALPISIDIESGYGTGAEEVAETVRALLEVGVVGCNIEDGLAESGGLRTIAQFLLKRRFFFRISRTCRTAGNREKSFILKIAVGWFGFDENRALSLA